MSQVLQVHLLQTNISPSSKVAILTDLLENQGHSVEIWHKRSNSFLQQYVNIFDKP
jgi:hypothetical protein